MPKGRNMDAAQFSKVKTGDKVFLDFSKYSGIKSITGRVIDKTDEWAVVYELRADDSWTCNRWNKYFITSIVESSPEPEGDPNALIAKLTQENTELKSKLKMIVERIMEIINLP